MKDATNTQSVSEVVANVIKKHKVVLGDFGKGRFSPAMDEVYKDTQRLLGFDETFAHATAAQVGRDAGQLNNQAVKLSFGKSLSKDGKIGLKEVASTVKVGCTWALSIASICAQLDQTRKMGLIVNDVTVVDTILSQVEDAAARLEPISKTEMEALNADK
jgi:hypothetical protein